MTEREPIDSTFFGFEFSLPFYLAAAIIFLCGCYSFWVAYRAMQTGVHEWRAEKTVRTKSPKLFVLQVSLNAFLGVIAILGAVVMAFDLGMKP
jgi:hypothetical protein